MNGRCRQGGEKEGEEESRQQGLLRRPHLWLALNEAAPSADVVENLVKEAFQFTSARLSQTKSCAHSVLSMLWVFMAHCHLLYACNECSWLPALELPSFACLEYHHHHRLRHQHVQCSLHAICYLPLLKASSTATHSYTHNDTHTRIPKRQRENRNGFPSPLDALWPPLADAATNWMAAATATCHTASLHKSQPSSRA